MGVRREEGIDRRASTKRHCSSSFRLSFPLRVCCFLSLFQNLMSLFDLVGYGAPAQPGYGAPQPQPGYGQPQPGYGSFPSLPLAPFFLHSFLSFPFLSFFRRCIHLIVLVM